ncbi:hypothetical protein [Sphingomonas xinjiangensis]|uniref:Lipoprotein n=1 Tax=Sphingomonas xinjiangensis TaxID=643568 RepID=A0A840YAH2_9SPHN|nr:hypothetical protein [Sphingomonas xinjiangensis]MBB5710337.1 hypothetical protein [Sphingomonas xinjiangensis]
MRAGLILSVTAVALAGCGNGERGETRQQQEQARATQVKTVTGWQRAFTPDLAVSAANQFGFHAQPYAAAAQGQFRTQGGPIALSDPSAKQPNQARFAGTGSAADRIDMLSFDLTLADATHAAVARTRFADLVRDYLFQSKIDGGPIHAAIAKEQPSEGDLAGIQYKITSTPQNGAKHLSVTFHRIGASAPANS